MSENSTTAPQEQAQTAPVPAPAAKPAPKPRTRKPATKKNPPAAAKQPTRKAAAAELMRYTYEITPQAGGKFKIERFRDGEKLYTERVGQMKAHEIGYAWEALNTPEPQPQPKPQTRTAAKPAPKKKVRTMASVKASAPERAVLAARVAELREGEDASWGRICEELSIGERAARTLYTEHTGRPWVLHRVGPGRPANAALVKAASAQ